MGTVVGEAIGWVSEALDTLGTFDPTFSSTVTPLDTTPSQSHHLIRNLSHAVPLRPAPPIIRSPTDIQLCLFLRTVSSSYAADDFASTLMNTERDGKSCRQGPFSPTFSHR